VEAARHGSIAASLRYGINGRMGAAIQSDEGAEAVAREFARALCAPWQSTLDDGVLGIYCIGSLAHGGFSRRYSDIDVAVIVQEPMAPAVLDALRADAARLSAELAAKLSIFWTDRSFAVGRFPVLDRIDYLDHAVALMERERVTPSRPSLAEVRAYLAGPPFGNWCNDARRFAASDAFDPKDRKSYLRTLLYPARLIYSWTTGRMGSNDAAVTFLAEHAPRDLDVNLIGQALECRRAGDDSDRLFPARAALLRQVAACERVVIDRKSSFAFD
jgi:predicted nucleotidyltransferase